MKNLREYLEEQINENLIQAVLSAGRNKRWHIKNKDSSDPAERTDLLSGICHRRTESYCIKLRAYGTD